MMCRVGETLDSVYKMSAISTHQAVARSPSTTPGAATAWKTPSTLSLASATTTIGHMDSQDQLTHRIVGSQYTLPSPLTSVVDISENQVC